MTFNYLNQYHNKQSVHQPGTQVNNGHPHAMPNTGIPTQTQVPVGSLNVEWIRKCKTIQVANMSDSLDMDIFATIEHHHDDMHFRAPRLQITRVWQ